jgi:hypothetical protein
MAVDIPNEPRDAGRGVVPMLRLSVLWSLCLATALAGCDANNLSAPPVDDRSGADGSTPTWARRTLFGHLSPMLALVHVDGGIVDGVTLIGKKHLIVFWDHATRVEQGQAANMLQVLQKADHDLRTAGIDVIFAQVRFPTNDGRKAPMNDTDLRNFHATHGIPGGPVVPMYRFPNATEHKKALMRGLEGSTTVFEYLREPPAIVLYDAQGTIQWHSEGLVSAPPDMPAFQDKHDQYTLVQAIEFAMRSL